MVLMPDREWVGGVLGTLAAGMLVTVFEVNELRGRVTGVGCAGSEGMGGNGASLRSSTSGLETASVLCSLAVSATVARLCLGVELPFGVFVFIGASRVYTGTG